MTRDERTLKIHGRAVSLGLWRPKKNLNGFCRTDKPNTYDGIECGEVYSDFWHVKIFDDGTYQLGWLEYRNGTTLVTRPAATIDEVFSFLEKQR